MKVFAFQFAAPFAAPKEKTTVKRMLLILAAAVLFLNTLVIPTVAHADGGSGGGTNCGGSGLCKP
jgi:hypothetical protein